jgi:hypothetical protein
MEPPCADSTTIITNLLANATNLQNITVDCGSGATYTDSGVYIFNADTTCGGSITFNGTNQIVDCQGNTVDSSVSSIDLLQFQGSGPYIVQNCPLVTPTRAVGVSISISVTGSDDGVPETVDVLIQDTSAKGGDQLGQAGAYFDPRSGKAVCASIRESVFMDNEVGVFALGQTFLSLSDVTSTSNRNGLAAIGADVQLDVKDSVFCSSSSSDVFFSQGATGTFSNTTCSSTFPASILNETCAMSC